MYSDSDLPTPCEEDIPDNFDDTSSDWDGYVVTYVDKDAPPVSGLTNMDGLVEARMDQEAEIYAAYTYVFEREGSPFRATLPEVWIPEEEYETYVLPHLSALLDVYTPIPPTPAPAPTARDSTEKKNTAAGNVVGAPISRENGGAVAAPRVSEEGTTTDEFTYKHGPASRFLSDNLASCILIPIAPTVNRKELCEAHGSLSGAEIALDFHVGYTGRDPYGWALPMTTDPHLQAKVKALYPGARPAEEADVIHFMKAIRAKDTVRQCRTDSGAITAVAVPHAVQEQRMKVTRMLSKRMASTEALLSCVEEAGGWAAVTWVAFDAEIALSTKGSVPLPLEYAFVPVDKQRPLLHFFTHPGSLLPEDELQAMYTAVTVHGIPIRNANFLSNDYAALATTVKKRFLDDKRVILINKGAPGSPTLVDAQCIRWLFAAAAATASSAEEAAAFPTPEPEDLRIFDISVLQAALAGSSPDAGRAEKDAKHPEITKEKRGLSRARAKACWYHKTMASRWWDQERKHCAQTDAFELRDAMTQALQVLAASAKSADATSRGQSIL